VRQQVAVANLDIAYFTTLRTLEAPKWRVRVARNDPHHVTIRYFCPVLTAILSYPDIVILPVNGTGTGVKWVADWLGSWLAWPTNSISRVRPREDTS
jgi:hypothetical protein